MVDFNGGARRMARWWVQYNGGSPRFRPPDIDWQLAIARFKYYGWIIFTKLGLGVVYLSIVREGFRYVMPVLGMKISRVPGFGFLAWFSMTYRLDLAAPMALFVLLAVFWLWDRSLGLWLHGHDTLFESDDPLFRMRREMFFYSLSVVVLLTDSILFYVGLVQNNWGQSMISFTAFIATVLYSAVLVFVTLLTLDLRQKLNIIERENHEKLPEADSKRDFADDASYGL